MPGGIGLANPQFPYKSYFDPIGTVAPSPYIYDVTTKNQFALRSFKDNVGNCFTDMVLMSDGANSTSTFRLFTNTPEGNAVERMSILNTGTARFTGDITTGNILYVGTNTNDATPKTIYFGGTYLDNAYDHCVIENRIYASGTEKRELLLFSGNDIAGAGPDRIRLRGAEINFDTYSGATTNRTAENIRMTIDQSGRVGIGITTPSAPLDVVTSSEGDYIARFKNSSTASDQDARIVIETSDAAGESHLLFQTTNQVDTHRWNIGADSGLTPNFYFQYGSTFDGGTNAMVIKYGGNVGIGLTNPGYQLQLSTDSAGKPTTSTWSITSDQRIKEDIVDANLDTCYENVKNLKLKYYKLRDDIIELDPMFKDSHKLGWIAQEVEKVLPKCVTTIPEQYGLTEVKNLNTDQIHVNLFGAVQKLIKDNENLKARIEALENRV